MAVSVLLAVSLYPPSHDATEEQMVFSCVSDHLELVTY
jgi:hypothetical protein